MKHVIVIGLILTGLFLVSCRDYTATSVVKQDGSIERTIEVESDSSLVFAGAYPVPKDSTWQILRREAKDDSTKIIYAATKFFPSATALNQDLSQFKDSLSYLQYSIRIDRRFRWFNTYLTYHEIYAGLDLFTALPMEDFLTPDEIKRFSARDTSEALDDRLEAWHVASATEELYQVLEKTVVATPESDITSQDLNANRDSLLMKLSENVFQNNDLVKQVLEICESVFPTANTEALRSALGENLRVIQQKLDLLQKLIVDNYALNVHMPGLIIDTNADALEGNMAHWSVVTDSLLYRQYDAWVQARIINTTLLFATLICLGILFSLSTGLWLYRLNKKTKTGMIPGDR